MIEYRGVDMDDSNKSNWISYESLLSRLKTNDKEIFEFLIKRLQPYNRFREPVPLPQWYKDRLIEQAENEIPWDPDHDEKYDQKVKQLREELSSSSGHSWKFVKESIESGDSVENLIPILKTAVYKENEVIEIEKMLITVVHKPTETADEILKTLSPSQKHREECRKIARRLWKEDPSITIADMI